jgi:tetratricopeptide (TPR) repeat protein
MRSFVFVFCICVTAATARAQDFDAAAKHFGAAQEAFAAKHFKTAAGEFEAAYSVTKDPILLYNIAESWEKAGDGKKAVASYRTYLKAQPNAGDKAEVNRRIKSIEARKFKLASESAPGDGEGVATAETAPPPAPTPTPPATPAAPPPAKIDTNAFSPAESAPAPSTPEATPAPAAETPLPPALPPAAAPAATPLATEERPPSRMRVVAWVGVASTVAVLTAGAILGLAAQSRSDEINRRFNFLDANGAPRRFDQMQLDDLNNLRSEGTLYNNLAIGFFSASAALAVATTVLFLVDWKQQKAPRTALKLAPTFDKNGGGLAASWSF